MNSQPSSHARVSLKSHGPPVGRELCDLVCSGVCNQSDEACICDVTLDRLTLAVTGSTCCRSVQFSSVCVL